MNKFYYIWEGISKEEATLIKEKTSEVNIGIDLSFDHLPEKSTVRIIGAAEDADSLRWKNSFEDLLSGIKPYTKKIDSIDQSKDPVLYNSIKTGSERQAEIEYFKTAYDKTNIGQLVDKIVSLQVEVSELKNQLANQG